MDDPSPHSAYCARIYNVLGLRFLRLRRRNLLCGPQRAARRPGRADAASSALLVSLGWGSSHLWEEPRTRQQKVGALSLGLYRTAPAAAHAGGGQRQRHHPFFGRRAPKLQSRRDIWTNVRAAIHKRLIASARPGCVPTWKCGGRGLEQNPRPPSGAQHARLARAPTRITWRRARKSRSKQRPPPPSSKQERAVRWTNVPGGQTRCLLARLECGLPKDAPYSAAALRWEVPPSSA